MKKNSPKADKTLYLIDGTALIYRSFFAIKLSTSDGFPTGAVYGFYKTLSKIIAKYKPVYLGVCFDISRKTFRQEKFKEYKIQRPPIPDGLKMQIPIVKELVGYLGIRFIEREGFEADDIIASLAKNALGGDLSVVIVSPDKDFCQLMVDERVSIYDYNKDRMFTKSDFLKEQDFSPEFMVDYLSLAGDSSDNVPGAKGIGKVGAKKLIKEYGNIKNIFKNINNIPNKTKDILISNKEMINLSRELVELVNCNLDYGWQDLRMDQTDNSQLDKIFRKLEFKSLAKALPQSDLNLDIRIIENFRIEEIEKKVKENVIFLSEGEDMFIFDENSSSVYKTDFLKVKHILKRKDLTKVSYYLKGQEPLVKSFLGNIDIVDGWFDIKIAAYLLNSALLDYSLYSLISYYLGKSVHEAPAYIKVYFIQQLYKKLSTELNEKGLNKLFSEVEMPIVFVLSKMQIDGVKIDKEILNRLSKEINKKTKDIKKEVFDIAGGEFNLNSPKQLGRILFEDLKIIPLKRTKTGYSTNEEVLNKLSYDYPIAKLILEYRHLTKLNNTYVLPIIEEAGKGFLHAQFNQTATQTGRLSSSSPNLQSVPAKGEFSFWIRKAFIPSCKGGYILSGDYSQIELRILAHLSCDEQLVKAFKSGLDIHTNTATLLFNVKDSQVDDYQRNIAKRVNFGIIYGMGAYGLSRELKISPLEAQNFIDDYFRRYPQIKSYIETIKSQAYKQGFTQTILGRVRKFPDIKSHNTQLREFAYRQAINAPIQGSCADLIKVAMVRIYNQIKKQKLKSKLLMQIHDELIFDVDRKELDDLIKIVRKNMEESIELKVPVKVNIKYGRNWAEMEDVS